MTELRTLAIKLLSNGPLKHEPSPRRVRVLHQGAYIFDTTSALLVWEHQYYPQYYLPERALRYAKKNLLDGGEGFLLTQIYLPNSSPSKGRPNGTAHALTNGTSPKANAIHFQSGPLAGYIRLDFPAYTWFEEDDEINIHPNDPYKRIDVRRSSRTIEVSLNGVQLASSTWAEHLYETGLPTRYYLPKVAVDWSLLRESQTRTKCPYKGEARYYDVVLPDGTVRQDLVWWYPVALPECGRVQGMVCFYNEKVDITVDGQSLKRPETKFG